MISAAIMARDTITGNARVIEDRWYKGNVRMAEVTILSRWQMTGRLDHIRVTVSRGQERTVMTTFAATGNTGVKITHEC